MKAYWAKPIGWRGESYRHYLARKGIATRYQAHKYFAKGVPELPRPTDPDTGKDLVASGHAQGKSNDELRAIGIAVPPPKKAYNAVDFTKLSAAAMPAELNEAAPLRFTGLPMEPIPQVEPVAPPVAPISAVTPITSEVIEGPLPSEPELVLPEESAISASDSVVPFASSASSAVPEIPGEPGMVDNGVSTLPAPDIVSFDNFPSS